MYSLEQWFAIGYHEGMGEIEANGYYLCFNREDCQDRRSWESGYDQAMKDAEELHEDMWIKHFGLAETKD